MRKTIARTILVAAVAFGAAACGFDTGATFNADGSVTVSLKFLFPKSLMDGANGATVTGMSPCDIAAGAGARFTLDRQTPIWKLSWTKAETFTAATGSDAGLVASVSPLQDSRLVIAVGFTAIAVGFLLGMLLTWRTLRRPALQPAVQVAMAPVAPEPAPLEPPAAWPGPPPGAAPPSTTS